MVKTKSTDKLRFTKLERWSDTYPWRAIIVFENVTLQNRTNCCEKSCDINTTIGNIPPPLYDTTLIDSRVVGQPYRWLSWGVASLPEGKSRGVFSASVCIVQASKHCVESLPLVLKDKEKLFLSKWKICCTAASWVCACSPEVGRLIDIWKPSIIMHFNRHKTY